MRETHTATGCGRRPDPASSRIRYCVCTLALCAAFVNGVAHAGFEADEHRWSGRVSFDLKPGTERSVARLDVLWPFWQANDRLVFTDFRLTDTDGSGFEGNFGLGYRQLFGEDDFMLGGYAFYDRRKSDTGKYYHQATLGAELFVDQLGFRVNGYLPEDDRHVIGARRVTTGNIGAPVPAAIPGVGLTLNGTNVITAPTIIPGTSGGVSRLLVARERALPDFDNDQELWLYGGYFRFKRGRSPTVDGPRVRAEYRFRDVFGVAESEISFGLEWQEDDVRGSQTFGMVRLRIPFGAKKQRKKALAKTRIARRMTEFVVRDIDIVASAQNLNAPQGSPDAPDIDEEITLPATDPVVVAGGNNIFDLPSGEALNVFFISQAGGGDCSQVAPCSVAVAQGQAGYGAGDSLVLLSGTGIIFNNIALNRPRQQILGSGDTGVLNIDLSSGDMLALNGLGMRPTLNGGITLFDEAVVRGFDITGGPPVSIDGNNVANIFLSDLRLNNVTNGIRLQGLISGLASDVTIQNATQDGVQFTGGRLGYVYL